MVREDCVRLKRSYQGIAEVSGQPDSGADRVCGDGIGDDGVTPLHEHGRARRDGHPTRLHLLLLYLVGGR